ncbi:hypothetical protein NKI38_18090 [Mesorhizobium sp. M0621]|uniref:hypothetical protein n=1 Tax=Mesorhizobium sp. M0621 TaxID=2956974 RepID=UPI00333C28C4
MIQDNATAAGVVPMLDAEQTIGATLASIRRQDRLLWQQIAGDVSGLLFYHRTRRG